MKFLSRDHLIFRFCIGLFVCIHLCVCVAILAQPPRIATSLDQGWRFHSGSTPDASAPAFDDSAWTAVNIPHIFPYEMHGTYKSVYRGEAWYRRSFNPPEAWKGKRISFASMP
jgi:beta-galactosidase/beta-glucuronidase